MLTKEEKRERNKQRSKLWRENNPEKSKANYRNWYLKNKKLADTYIRAWRKTNKEKTRGWRNEWAKKNSNKIYFWNNKRRIAKLKAQPPWQNDQPLQIIYDQCRRLSDIIGIQYHVDHIIPLRGKDVCGLHVPWNLQVIPAEENLSKGNRICQHPS